MHYPVLKKQVLEQIKTNEDAILVDGTIGYAGHTQLILEKNSKLKVIGLDQDSFAIDYCRKLLARNPNVLIYKDNFKNLETYLLKNNITKVDYFLFDLGVSSIQIDQAQRGFSYTKDAYLDMRMDQQQVLNAWNLVNETNEVELTRIFSNYAEVKLPRVVAKAIVKNRPIETTLQLVELIKKSLPARLVREKNHAKTVFQALRIAVNDELNVLKLVLDIALRYLAPKGKIMVITFHSIEDKIVKNFFGNLIKDKYAAKVPIMENKIYSVKTYRPNSEEVLENRRSRSAKLRVLIKKE